MPQLAVVRYVLLGGRYVTSVVGAVAAPITVAGLDTPVPPEMLALVPAPLALEATCFQDIEHTFIVLRIRGLTSC